MRRYYRPLIVVFSSLALASLFSYAAVELTEPSRQQPAPSRGGKATCEVLEPIRISPAKQKASADQTPLSAEESKLLARKTAFQEALAKATAGDVDAMFEVSGAYLVGIGTPIDRPSAAKWLSLAAEKGHVQARFSYGQALLRGEICPKDTKAAMRWFRLAAEKDNADAELSLAQAYASGEGVEVDEKQYLLWLKRSATHGHPIAQAQYANSLFSEDKPEQWEECADWLRKASLQGNPYAMLDLGLLHLRGRGATKNLPLGLAWLMLASSEVDDKTKSEIDDMLEQAPEAERRKAIKLTKGLIDKMVIAPMYSLGSRSLELSNQFHRQLELAQLGDADDQYALARLYHEGIGTIADPFEAAVWCRKAAEKGHVEAMRTLAICLEKGEGVTEDLVEMVKWYRLAAEKDDPQAQFKLGVCYKDGTGIAADEKQAAFWTKKAADHGHPIAQANLGSFLLSSDDEARFPEAVKWFKLSAKQGHPGGMYKYGLALFAGMGVAEDRVEGAAWLMLCQPRMASEDQKTHIKETLNRLTPEEKKKAEAAAAEIQKTL